MLDFIKYTRFKFREHNEPCEPRGPNFSDSRKYTYSLLNSKLSFTAPTQYHFFRPGSEQRTPKWNHDNLDQLHNRDINSYKNSWVSRVIFQRNYAFYGPWFSGEKASAGFILSVTTPDTENRNINFLHPSAFESAISGYLTATVGHLHHESDGEPYYRGPIDWKPIKEFPVPAVQFSIESLNDGQPEKYFCFPISKERILTFEFFHSQHVSGSIESKNSIISPKPARKLIENIISSVKLTPSAELERDLEEVKKICPNLAVSEEFPPLKWPATVDGTGLNIVELNPKQRRALVS